MNNLPDLGDNNNKSFIHTCPGCGVPYAQQQLVGIKKKKKIKKKNTLFI